VTMEILASRALGYSGHKTAKEIPPPPLKIGESRAQLHDHMITYWL
jgi:hypothetical protein